MKIGEYVKEHGSDFLYILYNGHIAEYDAIKNSSVKESIDKVVFDLNSVHVLNISTTNPSQTITLINTQHMSKGFFTLTWNKTELEPSERLNRYRYWDKIKPDGTRTD